MCPHKCSNCYRKNVLHHYLLNVQNACGLRTVATRLIISQIEDLAVVCFLEVAKRSFETKALSIPYQPTIVRAKQPSGQNLFATEARLVVPLPRVTSDALCHLTLSRVRPKSIRTLVPRYIAEC